MKEFFFLALGNLKHRGVRSWLTVLGIFIGIAAVVSLISLGAGLREAVVGQFGAINPDELTIQNKGTGFGPPGSTVVEKLNEKDLELIERTQGVDQVIGQLIRVVKIEYNQVSSFKYVFDVPKEQDSMDKVFNNLEAVAEQGRLLREGDSGVVVIGSNFAGDGGKEFGKELKPGKRILINGKEFEIIGIMEKLSSLQINNMIIMPKGDLEEVLRIKGEYDLIYAYVGDLNKVESVAKLLENKLRDDRREDLGEESFIVQTPTQALQSIETILGIINAIVVGIAMVSLLVGGIGIANTMYTSVLERTKEIGIMKAVGAKNSDILWIFLIESGLLGFVGGVIGVLMGLGGAIGIARLANSAIGENLFRIQINYVLISSSVLFSFTLGILFGVFPAFQASKLNVVEALRK